MAVTRRFQVRDVVRTTEEYGHRQFVVVDINHQGYRAVSRKDKRRYNLTEDQIERKLGQVSEDDPILVPEEEAYDSEAGRRYCNLQARNFPSEAPKWHFLAGRNPGDKIRVVHRKTIFEAEFLQINQKRPLYPIRARIKGLVHDFHLEALLVPKG